eukprot:NODE_34_length_31639_cov_0.254375.p10 type:complete len:286 gc:universal NODE_34_length_31639_cov_0.254375:26719-25862(-)
MLLMPSVCELIIKVAAAETYSMDSHTISLMIWGGTFSLFLQYLLQAVITFNKKYNKMFALVVTALILCVVESAMGIHSMYLDSNRSYVDEMSRLISMICFAILWFCMIQSVTWLYVLRIESLGKYYWFDKHVFLIPWIIALFQVFTFASIILYGIQTEKYKLAYRYTSTVFTLISILLEWLMTVLLLKKLNFILEYRTELLHALDFQIKSSFVLIILLEVIVIILKCFGSIIDAPTRAFAYIIRVHVIIQFYDNLILRIKYSSSYSNVVAADAEIGSTKSIARIT